MNNCIFTPHCTEMCCDQSCPKLAQTSYLLERNGISINSPVFRAKADKVEKVKSILNDKNAISILQTSSFEDSAAASDLLAYVAICQNWKGSQLHCTVYHLRYSKYIEDLKQSWSASSDSTSVEYSQIWAENCNVLIVSGLDFVSFGEFESQKILTLIQTRQANNRKTVIVRPPNIVTKPNNMFATPLKSVLNISKLGVSEVTKW